MNGEDRRLSIGILIHDFALGGSERSAIRLGNAWAALGQEVTLLAGDPHGPLRSLVSGGVKVHVPREPIPKRRRAVGRLGRWAGRATAELGCDILFVPGNWHFRAIPHLRRGAGRRVPIVAKLSNLVERNDGVGLAQSVRLWSMRRRLALADRVVAMSDGLADDALAVVTRGRLSVIASPVLDDPPDPPCGEGQDLVVIGRLAPQKNVGLAIRAFASLGRPGLRLVIAGEGGERSSLEEMASRLGVAGQVIFTGRVDRAEEVLRDARLLLLPSAYEGYPAVAVEALAMGVPVLATRSSPAIPEILGDPKAGTIVAADPDAFAQAIRGLLARPAPERRALARLVAHHQLEEVARAYLDLFRTLAR